MDPPGLHSTEAPGALVQEEALGQTAWALRLHSDVLSLTTGHSKPLWLGFLMYKIRDETLQTSDEVLRTTHVNNCKGAEQRWHLGSRRGLLAARGGKRRLSAMKGNWLKTRPLPETTAKLEKHTKLLSDTGLQMT